jgi:hypothetical protein
MKFNSIHEYYLFTKKQQHHHHHPRLCFRFRRDDRPRIDDVEQQLLPLLLEVK